MPMTKQIPETHRESFIRSNQSRRVSRTELRTYGKPSVVAEILVTLAKHGEPGPRFFSSGRAPKRELGRFQASHQDRDTEYGPGRRSYEVNSCTDRTRAGAQQPQQCNHR